VALANLAAADADALLRREGLGGADAAPVTRLTSHCDVNSQEGLAGVNTYDYLRTQSPDTVTWSPAAMSLLVIVIQWLDQCPTSSARIVPAVYSPDGTTLPLTVTSTWLVFVL